MRKPYSLGIRVLTALLILTPWCHALAQTASPRTLHRGSDSLVLELEFPLPKFDPVDSPEGWVLPTMPSTVSHNVEGEPQLPLLGIPYAVQSEAGMRIHILDRHDTVYTAIRVAPSRGRITRDQDPSQRPRCEGPVYQQDSYFPMHEVQAGPVYQLHDQYGQSLVVYPLQYNPQRHTLRAIRKLRIALAGLKDARAIEEAINTSAYGQAIGEQFAAQRMRRTRGEKREKLLIVSPTRYEAALRPLMKWKRLSGMQVEWQPFGDPSHPNSIGDTAALKDLIRSKYASPEGLHYVLIVGSRTEVPSLRRMGARRTSDSDQAYGQVKGNDSYNEVYIGRFSARTVEHVKQQVEKTIRYERNLNRADRWLGSALGIASNDKAKGDMGETDRQHMRNIVQALGKKAYPMSDSLFAGTVEATSLNLAQKLNAGVGYVNYVGHGFAKRWATTGFSVDDIGTLTHQRATPFIVDVACSNGDMEEADPCFAEAWLWAHQNNTPTGAVAICAASDLQAWDEPMRAQDVFAEYVMGQHGNNVVRYGELLARAMAVMLDDYVISRDGSSTANTWNIFGDPSVMLRTRIPMPLAVTYDAKLHDGQQEYTLPVDVEGALAAVCITSVDGAERFHYATVSDGKAIFKDLALRGGERVEFAVTAFNHESFVSPELTVEGGSHVLAKLTGAQLHHANGEPVVSARAGEQIELRAAVCYQSGSLPANNVRIRYTVEPSQSARIVSEAEERIPAFTEYGCTNAALRCKIELDSKLGNAERVTLHAEVLVDDKACSKLTLSTIVDAPSLRIDSTRVVSDDNEDHSIAAGEAFTQGVWVTNTGTATLTNGSLAVQFVAGGKTAEKQVPIPPLAPNAQTMVPIPLTMPDAGVDSNSICRLRIAPRLNGEPGATTHSIVPMGRNYSKIPPEVEGYPFAEAGMQQITRILLPNEVMGGLSRRVKAVRIPVRFEGGNEGKTIRVKAFLQIVEGDAWRTLDNFDALFRQAPTTELAVKDGHVTIPVDYFDIEGLPPVCLTIVAEGVAAMQPYVIGTLRAKAARTVSYTKKADGTIAMAYHQNTPSIRLINAATCRYHFHVLAPDGQPTRNFGMQIGNFTWNSRIGGTMEAFLSEGHHVLQITSNAYRDTVIRRTIVGESAYDTIRLRAEDPAQLEMLVQSPQKSPVSQAAVRLGKLEGKTDAQGRLAMTIVPGSYELTVSAPGFEELTGSLSVNKRKNDPVVITLNDGSTAVDEAQNTLAVWPNPTRSTITMRMAIPAVRLTIYNVAGQVVKRQQADSLETTIDVSDLDDGLYLVEATDAEGKTQRTRFVKSGR